MEGLELALKDLARSPRRKRHTITEIPGKRERAERKEIAASWGNSCPYSKHKPAGTGVVNASTGITSFNCWLDYTPRRILLSTHERTNIALRKYPAVNRGLNRRSRMAGHPTIRPSLTMSAPVKLFLKTLLSFHLKEFFSFVFFCFLSSLHRRPRLARNLAVGFSPTQPSLRSKLRP